MKFQAETAEIVKLDNCKDTALFAVAPIHINSVLQVDGALQGAAQEAEAQGQGDGRQGVQNLPEVFIVLPLGRPGNLRCL